MGSNVQIMSDTNSKKKRTGAGRRLYITLDGV